MFVVVVCDSLNSNCDCNINVLVGYQSAGILCSWLWTDHHVENLVIELWRRRLLAATDTAFPQQHPVH